LAATHVAGGGRLIFRRRDHFHELALDDRWGGWRVQLRLKGDDAAEGRIQRSVA